MLDLVIYLAQPLKLPVMIWGVGQHWQSATACWAMPYLPNEPRKLSLMLHGYEAAVEGLSATVHALGQVMCKTNSLKESVSFGVLFQILQMH